MTGSRWAAVLTAALLALVALLSGCAPGARSAPAGGGAPPSTARLGTTPSPSLPAGVDTTVERVVDGDTLVVAGGRPVRLIGVDTPETKDPRRPVQCFGQEASAFLVSLLAQGSAVRLVGDVEPRDHYGRTLAYVYRLPDGLFVNAELLRQGFAQVLTVPPNVAHAETFATLGREAREAGAGLWSACDGS